MKKSIIIISILLLSLMVFTSQTFATSVPENVEVNNPVATENNNPTLYEVQNEVMPISVDYEGEGVYEPNYIEDDVYMTSDTISLEESVNGNVYLFGDKIDISSNIIFGNVYAFGNTVNVNADVTGSLYVMAEDVTITGGASDAYICAGKVNFEEDSYISRNARVFSENLNIKGSIERDLYTISEQTNILDVTFAGVQGKLYYKGNLNVEGNAYVGEKIELKGQIEDVKNETKGFFEIVSQALSQIITVSQIFTAVFLILILGLFAKKYDETKIDKTNYGIAMLKGFGYLIIIPIIAILLIVCIIGIPLGIILFLAYMLMFTLSIPVVSLDISKTILKEKANQKWKLILTAIGIYICLEIIKLIPILGGIIRFLSILYGFELIVNCLFGKNKHKKNDDKIIVTTEE